MAPGHWPVYLENLRLLPAVRKVTGGQIAETSGDRGWDGEVDIHTASGRHHFLVEEKRGTLNAAMAERVLSILEQSAASTWILLAPYVTPRLAEQLAAHHVNFMDQVGNCHLELPPGGLIHVVGRSPPLRGASTALTLNGYRVLLALLIAPRLADATVRELAAKAGVSKSTAADALRALAAAGLLHETKKGRVLEGSQLLDRWVAGYADQLRPSMVLARYQPADKNLVALEAKCEEALRRRGVRWAFTGGVAAQRLTGHYRGDTAAVHLERPVPELARELRLAPSPQGILTVLQAPSTLMFDEMPLPGTAPAALVYAELLITGGERAREAAEIVRARYLPGFA